MNRCPEMSETDWLTQVIDTATLYGWKVAHHRPALTAKGWRTATQGHIGVPDLILARDGSVILAELKANGGRLRPEQTEWLRHLGDHGCVWRPKDADQVLQRLARTR